MARRRSVYYDAHLSCIIIHSHSGYMYHIDEVLMCDREDKEFESKQIIELMLSHSGRMARAMKAQLRARLKADNHGR
jgi:hypothetical protein